MIRKFQFVLVFIASSILFSCSSNNGNGDMIKDPSETTKELKGSFVAEAHPTSGTATINIAKTKLNFINFKTDAGPKLEVWVATSRTPSDVSTYKSLGELKGVNGNYNYDLPKNIDYKKFNHIVIWCVDFSVSFGYAIVK